MQEAREAKVKSFDYGVARQKLLFAIEQQKQALAELVARQQQQSTVRRTSLVSAQVAADKAQQKVDELRDDLEAFEFDAPFDGIAYAGEFLQGRWKDANPRLLREDEKLPAGQVIMTLIPKDKLRFVLEVPEDKLRWISAGLKVQVIPTGLPDASSTATCGDLPPAGVMREREQFFLIPAALDTVDPRLRPGQKATARIDLNLTDVLVVPVTAVSKDRVKIVGPDGESRWQGVVTGATDGEMIEIYSGLKEGDEIFTRASK
jgi:multidrug efflux pump subunit AcrA (membrane-fusion protein)